MSRKTLMLFEKHLFFYSLEGHLTCILMVQYGVDLIRKIKILKNQKEKWQK